MTDNATKLEVMKLDGKSSEYSIARSELAPEVRHAALALNASADLFSGDRSSVAEMAEAMTDIAAETAAQDMSGINRMLTAQALSLDALFTQMARRANLNLSAFPDAAERYMRLAFKAQAQSRATLETLLKMHQPREQTVRHIHVGPEGQAVFIENMHGGLGNARTDGRPYAQGTSSAALPSPHPLGDIVPSTCGEGEAPLPDARGRRRKRGAARE